MKIRSVLSVVLLLNFIVGCGGESSSSKPAEREVGHISGVVFDAAVSKSVVSAYEFKNGRVGKLLGFVQTNSKGEYSLEIKAGSMPVYIESVGGGYLDPYTKTPVDSSSVNGPLKLITYINYSEGNNHNVMVTPLTNFSAGLTEYLMDWNKADASAAIRDSKIKISGLYGFDVFSTRPFDLTLEGSSGQVTEQHKYGALLAAYSSYAYEKLNESTLGEKNIYSSYNLSVLQYLDVKSDGILDGNIWDNNGFVQTISFGHQIVKAELYTNKLAQHMLRVVNDPEINKSGTSADQYNEFSEQLNNPDSEVISGTGGLSIDSDVPVVSKRGGGILSLIDRIEFDVSDYIGIRTVSLAFEYQDSQDEWHVISSCNDEVGGLCYFDSSSFVEGQQVFYSYVDVDTRELDFDGINVQKARISFFVSDVFGNKGDSQSIEFLWDNLAPEIEIDKDVSPTLYNPNADGSLDYILAGTIKDTETGIAKPVKLSVNSGEPETLACVDSISDRGDNICRFSVSMPKSVFKGNGTTGFKVEVKDNNNNKSSITYNVFSDEKSPIKTIEFPSKQMNFLDLTSGGPKESEDYLGQESFTDMGVEKYLKIDYKYAIAGLTAIDGITPDSFLDFNAQILDDNKIPYIKVTVSDDLADNTGTSAEKLILTVKYEAGKSFDKITTTHTITNIDQDKKHVIPHNSIGKLNEGEKLERLTYYIPFTKDIFGSGFKHASEGYVQRITVSVKDESGNKSDQVFTYSFRSTFALPVVTVFTPFLDAKATLYRIVDKGAFQSVSSCDLKPVALKNNPSAKATDLASCSLQTSYDGEVHKISLSGGNVKFYQWSQDDQIGVNLDPDTGIGPYGPISGYTLVNGSNDIYLTELSVFQSGFFDSLWNVSDKSSENARDILKLVNNLFLGTGSFFHFNPILTSYATNEDLEDGVPSGYPLPYQHRFIVEALGEMENYYAPSHGSSVDFAKAFYADFSDGLIDGENNGKQITYGGKELGPKTYRSDLAKFYFNFVHEKFGDGSSESYINDITLMYYANSIATAYPTLNGDPLFKDTGVSIDETKPLIKTTIKTAINAINNVYKDGRWYIKDVVDVLVGITDPSGVVSSEFKFFWAKDSSEAATQELTSITVVPDIVGRFEKTYQFNFDSISGNYPNIQRMEMLISASDEIGNAYNELKGKHSTTFIVDNSPPFYKYTAPYDEKYSNDTYINLNYRQVLKFDISDAVGEDSRSLRFKDDDKKYLITEMETKNNKFSISLCKTKVCSSDDRSSHSLDDGKWKLSIAGTDKLGNAIGHKDTGVQTFNVFIDSTPPVITSNESAPITLGGNEIWLANSVINYGTNVAHSDAGNVVITLYGDKIAPYNLTVCADLEDCSDRFAYLIGSEIDTKVQLNAEQLDHEGKYRFDIAAEDSAYPANVGNGEVHFIIDKEGPYVTFDIPAIIDTVSPSDTNGVVIVGREFFVNILNMTDDSRISNISLSQKLDDNTLFEIIKSFKPNQVDNLSIEVNTTASDKITPSDNDRIRLIVTAEDEHGFISHTAPITAIFDNKGPTITLDGHNKQNFYAPGYIFDFSITDIGNDSIEAGSVKYWEYQGVPDGVGTTPTGTQIVTTLKDYFNLKIEAKDVRGNLSNTIFDVKVDSTPPTGTLAINYPNGDLIPENEVISQQGALSLVLNVDDPESGVSRIEAILKRGDEAEGSNLTFVQDSQDPTLWTTLLTLESDGNYSIDINVYNATKTNSGQASQSTRIFRTVVVKRGGYQLSVTEPANFSTYRAGKNMNVEFSVAGDDFSGLQKLQCWIRDNWTEDKIPEGKVPKDTDAPYVSYEGASSPVCKFKEFTEDLDGQPLVLITKTTGGNGTEVIQKFSFEMIDVTAPTINNNDNFRLDSKSVFIEKGIKKLRFTIEVNDALSGIKSEIVPRLITHNNFEGLEPYSKSNNGEKTFNYQFVENYTAIIKPGATTHTVSLKNVTDQTGNVTLGDNKVIKLNVPGVVPLVNITNLVTNQWVMGTRIAFNFRTKLAENSELLDVKVQLNNTTYSFLTDDTKSPKFSKFIICSDDKGVKYRCSTFTSAIPDDLAGHNLPITVSVFDYWDNIGSDSIKLQVDNEKPIIADEHTSLTREGEDIHIGFDISDGMSQIANVRYRSNIGNTTYDVTKNSDENFLVMNIPISKIGDAAFIYVDVTATDKVGLKTNKKIKVPLGKPEVTVTFEESKIINYKLLLEKQNQPFSITVKTDENSKVKAERYSLSLTPEDGGDAIISAGNIDETINGHLNFIFPNQGVYQLTVSVFDNIGREISTFSLSDKTYEAAGIAAIIDMELPVISGISMEQPFEAPDGQDRYRYIVRSTISDSNLDGNSIIARLAQGSNVIQASSTTRPDQPSGEYIFEFRAGANPGDYKLSIKAEDFAKRLAIKENIAVTVVDFPAPTLKITADGKETVTLEGVKKSILSFQFLEDIEGFDSTDIKLYSSISGVLGSVNGLKMVAGDKSKWTANYTIESGVDDVITIKVDDGSYVNGAGINGVGHQIVINIEGSAPVVSNVNIKLPEGAISPTVGDVLTAAYVYLDVDGDKKDASKSIYQWYADGEAIDKATGLTYRLTILEHNKKIRFSVTPAALTGTQKKGDEESSNETELVGALVGKPLVFGGNVKITMDDSFSRVVEGGNSGTITYSSSLESVAMVNSVTGEVTMVGVGDTVIMATEEQNGDFLAQKANYELKVTKGEGTPLTVDISDVSRTMDDNFAQAAKGGNGGTITYSS
ncbi:hypothetical protein, partial [Moritella viscosa]|uniref:hypothetical protein n=1 Tax=Moritella viscosa TaxID=80854 RepID=UPI003B4363C8